MNDEVEKIDRGDVYIENIEPFDCDNCLQKPATKKLRLDLREMGMSILVKENYCETCAPTMAEILKSTLPPEEN